MILLERPLPSGNANDSRLFDDVFRSDISVYGVYL
jgi:hypothetical protein